MLKRILKQTVDLLLLLVTIGLFLSFLIEGTNISGLIFIMIGYIAFNIREKAIMARKEEALKAFFKQYYMERKLWESFLKTFK